VRTTTPKEPGTAAEEIRVQFVADDGRTPAGAWKPERGSGRLMALITAIACGGFIVLALFVFLSSLRYLEGDQKSLESRKPSMERHYREMQVQPALPPTPQVESPPRRAMTGTPAPAAPREETPPPSPTPPDPEHLPI